jgi:hypothetical protein
MSPLRKGGAPDEGRLGSAAERYRADRAATRTGLMDGLEPSALYSPSSGAMRRAGWQGSMNVVRPILGVALTALAVTGCNNPNMHRLLYGSAPRWANNNNPSDEQWMSDSATCVAETRQKFLDPRASQSVAGANSTEAPTCTAYKACLGGRGYYRSESGTLSDVPGEEAMCPDNSVTLRSRQGEF